MLTIIINIMGKDYVDDFDSGNVRLLSLGVEVALKLECLHYILAAKREKRDLASNACFARFWANNSNNSSIKCKHESSFHGLLVSILIYLLFNVVLFEILLMKICQ